MTISEAIENTTMIAAASLLALMFYLLGYAEGEADALRPSPVAECGDSDGT